MVGMPLLFAAIALYVVSFVIERVLLYLNARRKRIGPERPEPLVMGSGTASSQAAGYVADRTIHRTAETPPSDSRD